MKKNIVVTVGIGALLCIALCVIVTHAEAVDNAVLLEKQNPGYWNYLSPDAATTRSVPTSFLNGDKSVNLLAPNWREVTEQGMAAVVNSDGSVTVIGSNMGDAFNLTTTSISLLPGDYIYTNNIEGTDFVDSSGVNMYVWQGNAAATLDTLPDFRVDADESYHTGIHVGVGARDINVTFYPMIRLMGVSSEGYKPFDDETTDFIIYKIKAEEITEEDIRIFLNNVRNETDISVINFGDGYGIQFNGSKTVYGTIDSFGLINEVISEPKSAEEIYELINS